MAQSADITDLRDGDMKKLVVHSEAKPVPGEAFKAEGGGDLTLADFQGKITLVNFWATWCAPCRHEMPMLSDLQAQLGGDDFEVVTIASGRNAPAAMKKFFDEIEVDNLPLHADPKMGLSRQMGVLGLPVTVILDREGREIARLQGDADWSSDSAKAILQTLIDVGA
ncbi:TlpA family protein disulfide reductase [Roseovarius atlanticus]|uniref:TlpA family protein disulfide reductase n=1 Tax=Roseovarius atlanticus TaxID=1641875 RepID=UPI0021BD6577|nr:TlpA disulfide reductase family protein [Roseovarius atlanticus]